MTSHWPLLLLAHTRPRSWRTIRRTRIFFRLHFAIDHKSLWPMYTALAESAKEKQLTEGPSLIIFACKKKCTNYRQKVKIARNTRSWRRGLKMKMSKWAAKVTFFYFLALRLSWTNIMEICIIFNVLLTNIVHAPGLSIIIGSRLKVEDLGWGILVLKRIVMMHVAIMVMTIDGDDGDRTVVNIYFWLPKQFFWWQKKQLSLLLGRGKHQLNALAK